MSKIIIDNRSADISDDEAVRYVQSVMAEGKCSNYGKQYCYATVFTERTTGARTMVSSSLTKTGTSTFRVYRIKE